MTEPIKLAVLTGAGEEIALGTSRISIKLTGDDTAGTFALMEFYTPPGAGSALHTHSHEEETFYIHAGSMLFQLGIDQLEAGVGSVVHIPRGLQHSFQNSGAIPCTALILVTPAGLENYFRELNRLQRTAPDGIDQAAITALNQRYGLDFG
jgi:quercetin dioxygenase-like cupin family protein